MDTLHYDQYQFFDRRGMVSAENGISFEDAKYMQVRERKLGKNHSPTPEWAVNDRLLREVIVEFMERLARVDKNLRQQAPGHIEVMKNLCNEYVVLKKNDPLASNSPKSAHKRFPRLRNEMFWTFSIPSKGPVLTVASGCCAIAVLLVESFLLIRRFSRSLPEQVASSGHGISVDQDSRKEVCIRQQGASRQTTSLLCPIGLSSL